MYSPLLPVALLQFNILSNKIRSFVHFHLLSQLSIYRIPTL